MYFYDNKTVDYNNLYLNVLDDLKDYPLDEHRTKDDENKPNEKRKFCRGVPKLRPDSVTLTEAQMILIIVGSVSTLLILLIVGTTIYRQKMTWMSKIEKFRDKHQEAEPHSIMEDYFEVSWDRLLVKSEKIGSGAYGRIFDQHTKFASCF